MKVLHLKIERNWELIELLKILAKIKNPKLKIIDDDTIELQLSLINTNNIDYKIYIKNEDLNEKLDDNLKNIIEGCKKLLEIKLTYMRSLNGNK